MLLGQAVGLVLMKLNKNYQKKMLQENMKKVPANEN